MSKLAIKGSKKPFISKKFKRYNSIGNEEIDAVVKCLKESTQMGNYSSKFEKKISSLFDKKYGLYVNSGSSALYIGMEASNFPEGGEVITPALTLRCRDPGRNSGPDPPQPCSLSL